MRKQFCASFAQASFHTAWVKNGSRATQSRLPIFPQQQTFVEYEVPSPAAKAHLQFGTVIQENVGFDFEPASYPSDVVDRDVPLRPLDAAEISAIDAALVG